MTTFPTLTGNDVAGRIWQNFPTGWSAKLAPNMNSLFEALGNEIAYTLTQMQYALNAQRMQTETSPELDLASEDFFGSELPRPFGASDAQFYTLIQANLFKRVATRQAISEAIQAVTYAPPRLIEPWNIGDTGARDTLLSYRDVDTAENPLVDTDAWLAYNGFIKTIFPYPSDIGNNPFYTRDDSGYADANDYQINPANNAQVTIYDIVNKVRAYGCTIWIQQIVPQYVFATTGGVLYLLYPISFVPTAPTGLANGAIYSNAGVLCVAGTTSPNPLETQLYYPNFTIEELIALGGSNMPLTPPTSGSGQLWNNGGVICVA